MNAKNLLSTLLLLSLSFTGVACSATTSSASHAAYDTSIERVAELDHASGRPTSASDLRMAIVRR